MPLRVAAIDFLNPAPLMWDFEHPPRAEELRARYTLGYTAPAECARQLLAGEADLGLIPVACLTPGLAIVPGCAIASLGRVRSIQLVVKQPLALGEVRTVAADNASRSSVAYVQVLFRYFLGARPEFAPAGADLPRMLATADAALVIGDPALLALEHREAIEQQTGPCTWYDVAELWIEHTGLPWVAAVWAVRPEAVPDGGARTQLIDDLTASRAAGLRHIEALVEQWTPRIAVPPATIRTYLTENISYTLDDRALHAIERFRFLAASVAELAALPELNLLST